MRLGDRLVCSFNVVSLIQIRLQKIIDWTSGTFRKSESKSNNPFPISAHYPMMTINNSNYLTDSSSDPLLWHLKSPEHLWEVSTPSFESTCDRFSWTWFGQMRTSLPEGVAADDTRRQRAMRWKQLPAGLSCRTGPRLQSREGYKNYFCCIEGSQEQSGLHHSSLVEDQ